MNIPGYTTAAPHGGNQPANRREPAERLYDLHIHSNFSDGRLNLAAIIGLAVDAGLSGISITDHDTVSGLHPARCLAHQAGLYFVPGIELNTDYCEEEVHILGYFIDPDDAQLTLRLNELKLKRQQRARQIVQKLAQTGCPVDFERVRQLAGSDLIGRPHVARAMVEKGYVRQESDAFKFYIGRNQPAYVPRYNFTPQEAVELVLHAGGLPFIAHPGKIMDKNIVAGLIKSGIVGLEVYYPEHNQNDIECLLEMAAQNNLLISGGSDFHGPGSGENRETLGLSSINDHEFQRILEYLIGKPG